MRSEEEQLYIQLSEAQFDKAIINCEQVFKEVYKMAIELEQTTINGNKTSEQLLQEFISDNKILKDFFKGMNQ